MGTESGEALQAGTESKTRRTKREQHRHARRVRDDLYGARFLSCLAASLLVMIAAAHLPYEGGWAPVGWHVIHPTESISVDIIDKKDDQLGAEAGTLITRFDAVDKEDQQVGDAIESDQPRSTTAGSASRSAPRPERLSGRRIFDMAHNMPEIVGGIGAYYIHIEYPEDALREGIQGRLVLSFIVETDGRTSGIEVIHPLYPACDSAAVRALRQTRFVPGRQNGEVVPVRMRIPVRFRIVERDDGLAATSSTSG